MLARRQEYEADRAAAASVGSRLAADALARTWLATSADNEAFWPKLRKEVRRYALPPADVQARRAQNLVAASSDPRAAAWLRQALRRYTDSGDTHPSLTDRLQALGEEARVPPAIERSAAEELLEAALVPLQAELAVLWRQDSTPAWVRAHERVARAQAQVDTLGARSDLLADEQLTLARAYEELDEELLALQRFLDYLELRPHDPVALFSVGRIRLELGDDTGATWIERAIERDRDLALAGYQIIASFHSREGRRSEADRYLEHAETRAGELAELAELSRGHSMPASSRN